MAQEKSPTPTEAKPATPAPQEPAPVSNGTTSESKADLGQQVGDASTGMEQTEPNLETFTSVDVKGLSPELKVKHDAMLTDYKKKTTEAAQLKREAEERLKEVQSVVQNAEFQRAYQAMNNAEKAQAREEMGVSDDDFNRAFESKEHFAQFVQKVARVSTAQSQAEIVNLKASLTAKDFRSSHPDFDELNEDGFITYQLRVDPRAQGNDDRQWQSALNDAYSNAKRVQQKLIERGRMKGLERVQQKAAASTEPPTETVPQVYAGGDPRNLTTAEAIELARQGIRVPRT